VLILRNPVIGISPAILPAPYFLDDLLDAGEVSGGNDKPSLLAVVAHGLSSESEVRADGRRHVLVQGFYNVRADRVYYSSHANRGYHKSLQGASRGPLIWTDPASGDEHVVAIVRKWNNLETYFRIDLPAVLD
jgi:hypothetical protein